MSKAHSPVAGVDGCRAGWLAVIAEPIGGRLVPQRLRTVVTPDCHTLLDLTSACGAVAVDMPIGLSHDSARAADVAARRLVGPRRSSVFTPPARPLLPYTDYAAANAASRSLCGRGLSRQTFNITAKIRDVDDAVTPPMQQRVVEAHPEVSFCALNAWACLDQPKRTLAGREQRRCLLQAVFGRALSVLTPPNGAAWDDLYDACVLAWTAARVLAGAACRLPDQPQFDARGLRMEIVY